MTESSLDQSEYDRKFDELDKTGQFAAEQIRAKLGDRPKSTPFAVEPTSEDTPTPIIEKPAIDPFKDYTSEQLAAAHEALASGEIDNFNGLNQADIAREVDRRYEKELKSSSTQAQADRDDVVR
ncbi:MAG: hypothetical protein AAB478_01575 [Patescibacteria group bacterium]